MIVTIAKNYQGGLNLSAVVNNRIVSRTYYGYTKAESVKMFKAMLKEKKGEK